MNGVEIYTKFSKLPENLQREVNDFIDFLLQKEEPNKSAQPKFGSLKGMCKIAPDFDSSIEDFKEYMQ